MLGKRREKWEGWENVQKIKELNWLNKEIIENPESISSIELEGKKIMAEYNKITIIDTQEVK